jgi:LysM repeat protein
MRDLTKEQAASGRRLHAFTLAILSVAGITTGMTMAVQAADLSVSPVQLAEADRTAQQGIPVADLSPNAPSQYTVRSGDTLWGISGQYLRQPWRWPQLWGMNRQQVHNPHLIYPGQILIWSSAMAAPTCPPTLRAVPVATSACPRAFAGMAATARPSRALPPAISSRS